MNEAAIIAGLKENDSRVFTRLFDEYFIPLCYFAEKITASKEEAEDIAIDTLRKCWSLRNNFESLINIKAFLYITARNACLNYLQHQRRQAERHRDFTYLQQAESDEDIESLKIKAEVFGALYNEVHRLPTKCRHVFELVLEGVSTAEIAKRLNISELNVRSQKKRALQLLRIIFLQKKLLLFFIKIVTSFFHAWLVLLFLL